MHCVQWRLWLAPWVQRLRGLVILLVVPALSASVIQLNDGLYYEHTLHWGESLQSTLNIHNPTLQVQTVMLYQMDERFEQGVPDYLPPGSRQRSNAPWLELGAEHIILPPQSTVSVPYRLQIPNDPQLSGSYWSIVMVQAVQEIELELAEQPLSGLRVQQLFRTAARIVTHIVTDPPARPQLNVQHSRLVSSEDVPIQLELSLANDGDVALHLHIFAEVIGANGDQLGRFFPRLEQARLLPNHSVQRHIDFSELPPGQYEVIVVAENHDGHVFGARYQILIE